MKSIIFTVGLFSSITSTVSTSSSGSYLWDLSSDPYESDNLFDNLEYAEIQSTLLDKLTSIFSNPDNIECDGKKLSVGEEAVADYWTTCGGVCSMLEESVQVSTNQIYFPDNPPNIVFMLADDWGVNDVGYKSTYMSWATPNIDQFVTEGVTMTNYFTHYFCAPSRGALMTGRSANRLGLLLHKDGCELPLSEVTIANEMKSAGYKTYMVGKWHLG